MSHGFSVRNRVRNISNGNAEIGETGTIVLVDDVEDIAVEWDKPGLGRHNGGGFGKSGHCSWVFRANSHEIELIEEDTTMAKKSNPKNFRNGDVVKVSDKKGNDAMVFVKFGENYYNLTAGGQMKACRYLPPGTKEIITNLSGMGKFFLMSEEELEEQTNGPFGGCITVTEDCYWTTPKDLTGVTTTDFISATDVINKRCKDLVGAYEVVPIIQTDTTEEK